MTPTQAFMALILLAAGAGPALAIPAAKPPPLRNPAILNIGFVCKWQQRCIAKQEKAMGTALKHVRKYPPPAWKIQLCNRNAGRNGTRVDWIGFNNCVRNTELRPPPKPRKRNR